jgi:hypothetical protein
MPQGVSPRRCKNGRHTVLIQLRHMRSGNQITALSDLFEKQEAPEFVSAGHFVLSGLPEKMQDPAFRYQLAHRAARTEENAQLIAKIMAVGNYYEETGLLARSGLVDPLGTRLARPRRLPASVWGPLCGRISSTSPSYLRIGSHSIHRERIPQTSAGSTCRTSGVKPTWHMRRRLRRSALRLCEALVCYAGASEAAYRLSASSHSSLSPMRRTLAGYVPLA